MGIQGYWDTEDTGIEGIRGYRGYRGWPGCYIIIIIMTLLIHYQNGELHMTVYLRADLSKQLFTKTIIIEIHTTSLQFCSNI